MSLDTDFYKDAEFFLQSYDRIRSIHHTYSTVALAHAARYALDAAASRQPEKVEMSLQPGPIDLSPAERETDYRTEGDVQYFGTPRQQRAEKYARSKEANDRMFVGNLVAFAEAELEIAGLISASHDVQRTTTAELVKELERRKQSGQSVVIPASLSGTVRKPEPLHRAEIRQVVRDVWADRAGIETGVDEIMKLIEVTR